MRTGVGVRRDDRVLAWAAGFGLLAPLGIVVTVGLELGGALPPQGLELLFLPGSVAVSLGFTALALLILRQQPGNRIAWLFLVCGVGIGVSMGLIHGGQVLLLDGADGGVWVLLLGTALGEVGWPLIWVLPHFFPDGRPAPGRFWHGLAWFSVGYGAFMMVMITTNPAGVAGWDGVALAPNPLALDVDVLRRLEDEAVLGTIQRVVVMGGGAASLVWRWWRADATQRRQISAFALAMVTSVVLALTSIAVADGELPGWVSGTMVTVAFAALPIGLGLSILRFRLYEIDRLVSRALGYAILTALLVVLYLGAVAVTTSLLPVSSTAAVIAATLACASAFRPLRRRLQGALDRRLNPTRAHGEAELEAYTERLRADQSPEQVTADLVAVVRRTVEPQGVGVWLPGRDSRV